ncbi:TPA: hypothetical protein JZF57_004335 [Escherichia coli]|jgi:hypothetical protein|uniref:hypothetical protein n=1 Tax=Enterobacteriaceae TaxID=543 RepID=UPI000A8022D5|nr:MULTISPECIES: hypothetical protein [Enterobacteriaceae]MEB1024260.1 hypothetical protein [Citrobacter freundii]HAT3921074.1 hypothetical protein [Kluyvera ascorbata]HCI5455462.1 hypothetical protein [Enterobacter kobei]EFK5335830.1 hypothetical protein [Escherichia coli]EHB2526372.1 hypothetical protein [Escherichia coli]
MEKPVMLIPERCVADPDVEQVNALRNQIRRAAKRRAQETQERAMAAPDYHWSAPRRR